MIPNVAAFARNPAHYARENRIPAALLLVTALVAIRILRAGTLPDQRGWIAIAGAAFAATVVASFAGDLVFYVLLIAIVVSMIDNVDILADLMGRGERRFADAFQRAA